MSEEKQIITTEETSPKTSKAKSTTHSSHKESILNVDEQFESWEVDPKLKHALPPIKDLQSRRSIAILLSFFGYRKTVIKILLCMS